MPDKTISNNIINSKLSRSEEFNKLQKELSDFYAAPLRRAVYILNKKENYSLKKIQKEVFNDELSTPAIINNYLRGGKDDK